MEERWPIPIPLHRLRAGTTCTLYALHTAPAMKRRLARPRSCPRNKHPMPAESETLPDAAASSGHLDCPAAAGCPIDSGANYDFHIMLQPMTKRTAAGSQRSFFAKRAANSKMCCQISHGISAFL